MKCNVKSCRLANRFHEKDRDLVRDKNQKGSDLLLVKYQRKRMSM